MFESRISAGATEKLPRWEKPHAKTVASCDMEVIGEARTKGEKVHFASLMDICHLKKC